MPHSGIQLKLDRGGGVTLFAGTTEIGQGSDDVLVAIVAEVLGIGTNDIRIYSGDTDLEPVDLQIASQPRHADGRGTRPSKPPNEPRPCWWTPWPKNFRYPRSGSAVADISGFRFCGSGKKSHFPRSCLPGEPPVWHDRNRRLLHAA